MSSLPPLHFHVNYQEEAQIHAASSLPSFFDSFPFSLFPSLPSTLHVSTRYFSFLPFSENVFGEGAK